MRVAANSGPEGLLIGAARQGLRFHPDSTVLKALASKEGIEVEKEADVERFSTGYARFPPRAPTDQDSALQDLPRARLALHARKVSLLVLR